MSKITFEQTDKEFDKVIEFFKNEAAKIRSGRANPDLISDIQVSAYESIMPLNQLANITISDATLLVVQPWDKSLFDAIEKAIRESDLGINPQRDGDIIRLPLPSLTQERREEYVKILKQKAEEARISIRQVRKEALLDLDSRGESGDLSEDDVKRMEKELQKKVDDANARIEEITQKKEQELMSV